MSYAIEKAVNLLATIQLITVEAPVNHREADRKFTLEQIGLHQMRVLGIRIGSMILPLRQRFSKSREGLNQTIISTTIVVMTEDEFSELTSDLREAMREFEQLTTMSLKR